MWLLLVAIFALAAGWLYWNRPQKSDMAGYIPAEALAFVELNDLGAAAEKLSQTEAWRTLAGPLNAPSSLTPNRWLIRLARWTGIGSTEAVLFARSQMALVFTQAQATENGTTLTIKPLAALVIETHTSQRRMRPVLEEHVGQFARRAYGQPTLTRKQVGNVELIEWASPDNSRRLVLAFIETTAVVGNDETVVLSCVEVRRGTHESLAQNNQLAIARQQLDSPHATVFAFVPKAGVKVAIQAWALSRAGNVADAASIAPIISNAFGNLIDAFAFSTRFDWQGAEDRCRVFLSRGVSQQLASNLVPSPIGSKFDFTFAPAAAISVTSYELKSPANFWRDVGTVVSSRTDVLAAIASKPLLQSLLRPYGINDADGFFSAVGPRLQLIRIESNMPAVLVAQPIDERRLRAIAEQRLGPNWKTDRVGEAEILTSSDGWSFAFVGGYFLSGPADGIRRCLEAKNSVASVTTVSAFRRTEQSIDLSLPIIALTISDDRANAISFVELFSQRERSAFSTNGLAIQESSANLPYSASFTTLNDGAFEWTSRSSFGLLGSLFTTFAPERSR